MAQEKLREHRGLTHAAQARNNDPAIVDIFAVQKITEILVEPRIDISLRVCGTLLILHIRLQAKRGLRKLVLYIFEDFLPVFSNFHDFGQFYYYFYQCSKLIYYTSLIV